MRKKIKNFRDLGGIQGAHGKYIRPGMLYRSGHLAAIKPETVDMMRDEKGLRTVVDLRSPSELAEKSDVIPKNVKYYHIPPLNDEQNPSINRKNRLPILKRIMKKEGGAKKHLTDIYRTLVTSKASLEATAKFLRLLAEDGTSATLWHCTQGKDRTGIATASLLMALGVSRKAIMRDYLRTNRSCFIKNKLIYMGMVVATFSWRKAHSLNMVLTSRRCYMNAAFEEIDRNYGGTEGYLKKGLGLTDDEIHRLRKKYLN
ncbi:MAG: tyrosine-protein phosphatase [Clostridia bacterium]|nr:tyrosine-protein phosphatase [Clostridia bacterium]